VALVTGASRGIGRAIARRFATEGARVVVNYLCQGSKADSVVQEIAASGGQALAIQADISDRAAVQAMVAETLRNFGGIDILVNNAGVLLAKGSLLEYCDDEFDRMWAVNVKGTLNCTRAVALPMMDKHYGRIINITSLAAFGTALVSGSLPYATTKSALVIITKCCALELGPFGVNVNAIAPGLTRTDMGLGAPVSDSARGSQYFQEKTMLGRIGEPEDIAEVALFLAGDASNLITGQVITADGGRKDFLSHSS
jgi:3-oxoacyl-[acyl-carrier protein] reductase